MMTSALVIAPHHADLPGVADEAASIANALQARILQGDVTPQRILDRSEGQQYDILWFATHCTDRGIELSSGTHMGPNEIVWLCNSVSCGVLVLSACATDRLVVQIQLHADVDVLFCISDVVDNEAMTMARAIALDYPSTNDLETSLRRVARGSGLYRYLRNARRAETRMNDQQLSNGQLSRQVIANQYQIENLKQQFGRIETKLDGLTEQFQRAYGMTVVNNAPANSGDYRIIIAAIIVGAFVFAGLYLGGGA